MLHNRSPQTEDGEDDRVLNDRREDAQDASHNEGLDGIETRGGRGGRICPTAGRNNFIFKLETWTKRCADRK